MTVIISMCACGQPAETELQVVWDASGNGGAGGGVYEPLCEACYASSPEAAALVRTRAAIAAGERRY